MRKATAFLLGLRALLLAGLVAALLPCAHASAGAGAMPASSLVSSPVSSVAAGASPEADLRAHRAFVLVVIDEADGKLKSSEAYGDWQSYLQSFAKRRGDLPVHQVSPERARKLLPAWPRDLRNATLFANPQRRGLLHRGLVLEPQVYLLGKAFAEGGPVPADATRFGLEVFGW
ncbi:hypothetical protein QTI66_21505 [Variovorax sp. J22R133]|uniref:hypothetical protein n=1 Tax=Variovorax brevis TaxID=3053503 RepID=UPI002574A618|nr:hypothetical protein [Variovorax sp. J22R133]MDM0114744.1 hypothetical protein [Variovorax sp. J22R133]